RAEGIYPGTLPLDRVEVLGGNSSFIALILKMHDAKMVKDFRPITLIESLYKIISKILANRHAVVLEDIVNEVQSAFIANRQILDGPFILNELFHWCKKKKNQTMNFKVDFEKAYDSVRWGYLDDVLNFFGFGDKKTSKPFIVFENRGISSLASLEVVGVDVGYYPGDLKAFCWEKREKRAV
nr:cysteine-rich receptor-like protein kinase [Tanacetum cinerariifolium]